MTESREVLVALIPTPADLEIARERQWYRIPQASVAKLLRERWPPQWVAFYQPKAFGATAFAVYYYAQVYEVRETTRRQLFPDQSQHPRANLPYYQLMLGPLRQLAAPIPSLRLRRIVFIPTTWQKLVTAGEINDLFDTNLLDDLLWSELRRLNIAAERQQPIAASGKDLTLDFAIYCRQGKLDVETDGDATLSSERLTILTERDHELAARHWQLLRFNAYQIKEELGRYCLPEIIRTIGALGGLDERVILPSGNT